MTRGNRKGPIYENEDDRLHFLKTLTTATERYRIRIYEFCLMGNHYHLLLDTPRGNLSDAMCYINGVFAQSSNWRHVRTGHLFGERFTSVVVPRELYLKRAARYIVLNPVEAGLVRHPSDWPWSSYRASVGIDTAPAFLHREWQLWAFDTSVVAEAQRTYCEYIKQGMTDHGSIIADDLLEELEEITRAKYRDRILPRTCDENNRPSLDELFTIPRLPRSARNLRIFEAHTVHGYRLSEIAKALKMDRSTPGAIVRRFQNGSPNSRPPSS